VFNPMLSLGFPLEVVSGFSFPNFLFNFYYALHDIFVYMWYFRSSTCHTTVHCFPFMILLTTHWSYMLIVNPQFSNVLYSKFQKSNAACHVVVTVLSLWCHPLFSRISLCLPLCSFTSSWCLSVVLHVPRKLIVGQLAAVESVLGFGWSWT